MSSLAISLLGSFQVTLAGKTVFGFHSKKVQALLAYLAVEKNRPHQRESLAGLLWPDYSESAARTNLRSALANLRQIIGDHAASPPFLQITRQTIQFDGGSSCQLDVDTFTTLLTPDGASTLEPESQTAHLEQAVALYQGPFLEGFSIPDSAHFEEWLLLKREELGQQILETLYHLADCYGLQQAYDQALPHVWRQVELAPWQEEAHRQLMRLLALSGQRSEALAHYETCCRLLREELGVDPAPETKQLVQSIRDGLLSSAEDKQPRLHNLPAATTPLIGRVAELAAIKAQIADPACRLLTLVGPGGSGKTRLALQSAIDIAVSPELDHFAQGVYLVRLAPLQAAEALVPAIAKALGFSFYDPADLEQQLLDYLRPKSLLLVLDNFEHLLAGANLLVEILEAAPQLKLLVTSRERLHLQCETRFPVEGLDYPPLAESLSTDKAEQRALSQFDAVKLFLQGVSRDASEFEPTPDDLRHIAQVCQTVQGMPLAILLAASWVQMLTPAQIVTQLSDQSVDFLQTDWRDLPARQRSLRAVFDHSWHLLTEREQQLFQSLSVFRGGFTQSAARQVSGASLGDLMKLVNKSLLQGGQPARYDMHELLRQYAAEKLAQGPDGGAAVRDCHAAYYAAFAQQQAADLKSTHQQEALAELETDMGNIRAAWTWLVDHQQAAGITQMIEGLGHFYQWRGRYREGEQDCRVAAAKLADAKSDPEQQALAWVLAWQGVFAFGLGLIDQTSELLQQSLAISQAREQAGEDSRPAQAFTLLHLGRLMELADRQAARRPLEQGLAIYRSLDDPWGVVSVLQRLGELAKLSGRYEKAERLHAEGLALCQSLGDRMGMAASLTQLSTINARLGRLVEAERLAREGLAIRQDVKDRSGMTEGLIELGSMLAYNGKFAESRLVYEEAVALSRELGMLWFSALALGLLSWIELNLGLYKEGRVHREMSIALYQEVGVQRGTPLSYLGLGQVVLVEGRYAEALELFEQGLAICRQIGQREEEGIILAELGRTAIGLGDLARARQYLVAALRAAEEIRSDPPSMRTVANLALLLVEEGQAEQAVELYALATRHPYLGNSRFLHDMVGRHIEAAAAGLSAEVIAAAQVRGRDRDLQGTIAELLVELET